PREHSTGSRREGFDHADPKALPTQGRQGDDIGAGQEVGFVLLLDEPTEVHELAQPAVVDELLVLFAQGAATSDLDAKGPGCQAREPRHGLKQRPRPFSLDQPAKKQNLYGISLAAGRA